MMDRPELLKELNGVSKAFTEELPRKELVQRILHAAVRLTAAERGSVFMAPEGEKGLASGRKAKLKSFIAMGMGGQEIEVEPDHGTLAEVMKKGVPLRINQSDDAEKFHHFFTNSLLSVPIRPPSGEILGVVEILDSRSEAGFSLADQQVVEVLALFAAMAFQSRREKAQLADQHGQKPKAERASSALDSEHPGLRAFFSKLPNFAQSDSAILIEGESGTGKEVIARIIHENSLRQEKAFVAINCAAIPESLFEAELFGVAKGAATGTVARKGRVELADGGTLFLDEIGELPLSVQAKLLRVLQEKTVQRVGSEETPKLVDFRVVSATNRDLKEMVREGRFREDLYYRVNVVGVALPPLRERTSDIPQICERILERFVSERGWKKKQLGESAIRVILKYHWPGNIRQLQNKLEGACIASGERETLEGQDLQLSEISEVPAVSSAVTPATVTPIHFHLKTAKTDLERRLIQSALEQTGGNKTQAARLLGITREGLRKAMKKNFGEIKKVAA